MKETDFRKLCNSQRRTVSKPFGWKQCKWFNYQVQQGYFFILEHGSLAKTNLKVKPMYADDLWWDIFHLSENKTAPLSLRANGAFSIFSIRLASYDAMPDTIDSYTAESIITIWHQIFEQAAIDMSQFLQRNPDADVYIPPLGDSYRDPDRLVWLMTLLHNGRSDEVVEYIRRAKQSGHNCIFHQFYTDEDSYDCILNWCSLRNNK